jgi:hypothetical protein
MMIHAALDPPGETKRQFLTLVVWGLFLFTALVAAAAVGTRVPSSDPASVDVANDATRAEIRRSRVARIRVAIILGLLAPAACTLLLARRHRRHGAHARGITVELTDAELRIWGRGYGTRVSVDDAEVAERLVDVYAGRLGAWRQVRIRLQTKARAVEIAAPASEADGERGLRLDGGEADCVELDRADYDALKMELQQRRARPKPSAPA